MQGVCQFQRESMSGEHTPQQNMESGDGCQLCWFLLKIQKHKDLLITYHRFTTGKEKLGSHIILAGSHIWTPITWTAPPRIGAKIYCLDHHDPRTEGPRFHHRRSNPVTLPCYQLENISEVHIYIAFSPSSYYTLKLTIFSLHFIIAWTWVHRH